MEIDKDTASDVVRRLRRIEGQVGGILRMIEGGRDCEDVVTQLAAVSRALNRTGFKIVASGMRQCLEPDSGAQKLDEARMERLFLSLA